MTRSPHEPRMAPVDRAPLDRLERRLHAMARQAGYALVPLEAARINDTEDAALAAIAVAEVRRLRKALETVRDTVAGASNLHATGKHQPAVATSLVVAVELADEALTDNPAVGIIPAGTQQLEVIRDYSPGVTT